MIQLLAGRLLRQHARVAGMQAALPLQHCSSALLATDAASTASASDSTFVAAEEPVASTSHAPPPPRPWSTSRSLPQPGLYKMSILIKGFEKRFVQEASTVLRDLMLIHFAPKGQAALSRDRTPNGMPHINLALPMGDASLKTQKTIYTVIRGPHVHKTSREQFAKITHRRVITHQTNNYSELRWFLDSLKLYGFHNVEITVDVTSSTYMQPPSNAELEASQQPLLAQHMQQYQQYFSPAPAAAPAAASSSSSTQVAADLQQLRNLVLTGLQELRYQLQGQPGYAGWAATKAASSSSSSSSPLQDLVNKDLDEQLLGSALADSSSPLNNKLVETAQQLLQRLPPDVLARAPSFGAELLQQTLPSDPTQIPQWLYTVLQLDKLYQQHQEQAAAGQLQQATQQYPQLVAALVYAVLRGWHQQVAGAAAADLGVPLSSEQLSALLPGQPDRQAGSKRLR